LYLFKKVNFEVFLARFKKKRFGVCFCLLDFSRLNEISLEGSSLSVLLISDFVPRFKVGMRIVIPKIVKRNQCILTREKYEIILEIVEGIIVTSCIIQPKKTNKYIPTKILKPNLPIFIEKLKKE
jgi:hypothetical protein